MTGARLQIRRGEFQQFCRYVPSLHPPQPPIAIVCDN